jgi:hypothetical protein
MKWIIFVNKGEEMILLRFLRKKDVCEKGVTFRMACRFLLIFCDSNVLLLCSDTAAKAL